MPLHLRLPPRWLKDCSPSLGGSLLRHQPVDDEVRVYRQLRGLRLGGACVPNTWTSLCYAFLDWADCPALLLPVAVSSRIPGWCCSRKQSSGTARECLWVSWGIDGRSRGLPLGLYGEGRWFLRHHNSPL